MFRNRVNIVYTSVIFPKLQKWHINIPQFVSVKNEVKTFYYTEIETVFNENRNLMKKSINNDKLTWNNIKILLLYKKKIILEYSNNF